MKKKKLDILMTSCRAFFQISHEIYGLLKNTRISNDKISHKSQILVSRENACNVHYKLCNLLTHRILRTIELEANFSYKWKSFRKF